MPTVKGEGDQQWLKINWVWKKNRRLFTSRMTRGHEEEFEVIMKFEVDGSEAKYMMVAPVEPEDGETDVYAFRYEEEEATILNFSSSKMMPNGISLRRRLIHF